MALCQELWYDLPTMHTGIIIENTRVTPVIYKITVELQEEFSFLPGQFVMIESEHTDKKIARAFSIASDSAHPKHLTWYMQWHPESVVTERIHKLPLQSAVHFGEARGLMTVPTESHERIVYVATSTGIAPFLSHLYHLADFRPSQAVTLYFGVRTEADVFALEEIHEFQKKLPNLIVKTTLSQPSEQYTGLRGRVTDHLKNNGFEKDTLFYLCGNKQMVIDARTILTENNVPASHIKFEIFF